MVLCTWSKVCFHSCFIRSKPHFSHTSSIGFQGHRVVRVSFHSHSLFQLGVKDQLKVNWFKSVRPNHFRVMGFQSHSYHSKLVPGFTETFVHIKVGNGHYFIRTFFMKTHFVYEIRWLNCPYTLHLKDYKITFFCISWLLGQPVNQSQLFFPFFLNPNLHVLF